jgi:hypothetical protein
MLAKEIGCEYLELSYPFKVSETGICILSDYQSQISKRENAENKIKAIDTLKKLETFNYDLKSINLSEKKYELDNDIIKLGCECFTCTKGYSKAYIHHLIKCNELNGKILIIM